jgi:hypothetical protein
VERGVEDKLEALIAWLQKQQQQQQQQQQQIRGGGGAENAAEIQAQVCLSFYEKRDKAGGLYRLRVQFSHSTKAPGWVTQPLSR